MAQNGPTEHVRQEDIQRNRAWEILLRQIQCMSATHREQYLEAMIACETHEYARIMRVVFHDQQNCVARFEKGAVVRNMLGHGNGDWGGYDGGGRLSRCVRGPPRGQRWADIFDGQIKCERAPDAWRAAKLNFASEQIRELAADRKAKARAAIFAAGARIRLLESLKNDLLLL